MLKIVVIGAGAAGFFAAIKAAEKPNTSVILLEKTNKILSKVRISGGGRCNVTHYCHYISELLKGYPRGQKKIRAAFEQFNVQDTITWFAEHGVILKTEPDGRMFPASNKSETIVNTLLQAAEKAGVQLLLHTGVAALKKQENFSSQKNGIHQIKKFEIICATEEKIEADRIIVATGGGTKIEHFDWLTQWGHTIVPPVPSLFTFHLADETFHALSGISVENVEIKVVGSSLAQNGPLLITHFGLSGPAVLKLSAWGARILAEKKYSFTLKINWMPHLNEENLRTFLQKHSEEKAKKPMMSLSIAKEIPLRLWQWILHKIEIPDTLKWINCSKKQFNQLIENLSNAHFEVSGKSAFKEEFVTAGGIDLENINMKTMESKLCEGLFFAGEVLDIDGVTGGYNFQAAWTTGYLAGKYSVL